MSSACYLPRKAATLVTCLLFSHLVTLKMGNIHVHVELSVFQFVHIAPCPVTGHHLKELAPSTLHTLYSYKHW